MREGLVVASWGLYLSMVAKSPESHTTVYHSEKVSLRSEIVRYNCSGLSGGGVVMRWRGTYGASGLQLIERAGHDVFIMYDEVWVCD
jgi:hypothetical protein